MPTPLIEDASAEEIDEIVKGLNLAKCFMATVRSNSDDVSIRFKSSSTDGQPNTWQEWSWNELAQQVSRVAGGLRAMGVEPGDRVVMMLRNIPEFHVVDLATLFLGATPISIYNSSSSEQVQYLASHCNAKYAIVEGATFLDRLTKVRSEIPSLKGIAVLDSTLANPSDDIVSYSDLTNSSPIDLETSAQQISPDTLATVIYTSGTTGPPKGVMLSHYTVCWTVESMSRLFGESITGKRIVSYLPMAHIAERMISHYQHIVLGPQVVDCPDLSELPQYLADVRPQIFLGVPRVWEKIYALIHSVVSSDPVKKAQFDQAIEAGREVARAREDGNEPTGELEKLWDKLDQEAFSQIRQMTGLDQVESAISGAAPITREVFDFFRVIGIPLSEVYGLSECCGPMTWERFKVRSGAVGKAIPGSQVKLMNDGEVICKGGHVFLGYLNDEERTAEMLDSQGWLHSGDIGTIDADGYLKIIDRKKELIITAGGKNISPANIEASLKSFPLIGQACVIGDARPFIAALIVLDPDVALVWAKQNGLEGASLETISQDPNVIAQVQQCVDESNKGFNKAEYVKKFKVLANEWLPDSEELTPTMKLKRRGINSKYAKEIEELYS